MPKRQGVQSLTEEEAFTKPFTELDNQVKLFKEI